MNKTMTDKELLTDVLTSEKSLVSLYNHAIQEAATEYVHSNFEQVCNEAIKDQYKVFKAMEQKGWYQVEQAQPQAIEKAKNKFTNNMKA